jgi:hypothetical protein
MRTKTLLLTAALGIAGAASSMAQVYSVNYVGYVNTVCNPGFSLIANPLTAADNSVGTLLATVPLGTVIFTFSGGNFHGNELDLFGSGWTDPSQQLLPGGGFFINNNQSPAAPFTITFVGEGGQGTLVNTPGAGFSILSCKVPQAGTVKALGLQAAKGNVIFRFDNAINNFVGYENDLFGDGNSWTSSAPVDAVNGPAVGVGEAFFYNNNDTDAGNQPTWTRNFNPNTP